MKTNLRTRIQAGRFRKRRPPIRKQAGRFMKTGLFYRFPKENELFSPWKGFTSRTRRHRTGNHRGGELATEGHPSTSSGQAKITKKFQMVCAWPPARVLFSSRNCQRRQTGAGSGSAPGKDALPERRGFPRRGVGARFIGLRLGRARGQRSDVAGQ